MAVDICRSDENGKTNEAALTNHNRQFNRVQKRRRSPTPAPSGSRYDDGGQLHVAVAPKRRRSLTPPRADRTCGQCGGAWHASRSECLPLTKHACGVGVEDIFHVSAAVETVASPPAATVASPTAGDKTRLSPTRMRLAYQIRPKYATSHWLMYAEMTAHSRHHKSRLRSYCRSMALRSGKSRPSPTLVLKHL